MTKFPKWRRWTAGDPKAGRARRSVGLALLSALLVGGLFLAASVVNSQAPTPTPIYIIVTNTPTPEPIYVIVTSTPTPRVIIVTATPIVPTPANSQTAVAASATARITTYRDQFYFRRPFPDDLITAWARNYSYGSTSSGALRVHHGVDISNPPGTPVLAAAGGTVFYAGSDGATQFGPQFNFYGNLVVLQHPFSDSSGAPVYSLYGHLSRLDVASGQVVQAGQTIGIIGATGVAAGTHLHFEVRVGNPTSYLATRNPELWVQPYPFRGVVAGRAYGADGQLLTGVLVEAQSSGGYQAGFTYGNTEVNGDTLLRENFAIPDLPVGEYRIFIRQPALNLFAQARISVRPGHVSWVELRVQS
jgi:murein DD-endopeptidase MepM/ murein hydrolase activator NlpD